MIHRILKRLETVTDKQAAITLFISAFFLRLLYAAYVFYNQAFDENNAYIIIAKYIIEQGTLFYDINSTYLNAAGPVIPWLNALTLVVFQNNYIGVYIVTALGSALITLYTYKTARLFLDKAVSLFAGLWATVYLFYFFYTPSPGKDIWMAFFMIFLVHEMLVLFYTKAFTWKRYLLFILMFVLAFHLDERFFIYSPFLFFYILYQETGGFKIFAWKKSLSLAGLTVLLMVPWTLRNYQKHEKIVLISTRTEAFTDKIFGYETRGHMMDEYNDIYGVFYIHENQFDSIVRGLKTETDGGWEIDQAQIEAMRNGHLPRPLTGVRAFVSRTLTLLEPVQLFPRYERTGYFYYKKSIPHNISTFLFYGIIFLFSFPGFYFLYKKERHVFYILVTVILVWVVIHGLTIPYTNWRYRLPLDAIFIMVGCLGIKKTYDGISG